MKQILVIFTGHMELGGIENSLLGLLEALDYKQYNIDLFVYGHHGALFPLIDSRVHLIPEVKELAYLHESFFVKLRHGCWYACFYRLLSMIKSKLGFKTGYEDIWAGVMRKSTSRLDKHYDLVLGFCYPFDYMIERVDADVKVGWVHTDYSSFSTRVDYLYKHYSQLDYIAAVSEECKNSFLKLFPEFEKKMIVVENIIPKELIKKRSDEFSAADEMSNDGSVKLLSVGRFCEAKNFDNVPDICKRILQRGIDVKWYLIGFGGDENLIREKIAEANMEKYVIILGKKDNPYPYIKACDIYVQPSRYEGKSVAVREAQMLNKPVIITNYATSASQLKDGYDGVIVPMDNEGCAVGIANVIRNRELQNRLIENTRLNDYTNSGEVEKLYRLIDNRI